MMQLTWLPGTWVTGTHHHPGFLQKCWGFELSPHDCVTVTLLPTKSSPLFYFHYYDIAIVWAFSFSNAFNLWLTESINTEPTYVKGSIYVDMCMCVLRLPHTYGIDAIIATLQAGLKTHLSKALLDLSNEDSKKYYVIRNTGSWWDFS